jgi:NADPH:quinone reductase-like Zn-dependent oxidoreductase
MKALRFQEFGGPEVLRLEEVPEPQPGPEEIRVAVEACGINPADWAIREGVLGGEPPGGIGIEAAGVVDAIGSAVEGVQLGDAVVGHVSTGPAGPTGYGGASEYALLSNFTPVPPQLDLVRAAALPLAVETAVRGLDLLDAAAGETMLIHGAGGAVGTIAVQIAVERGIVVIATAGPHNLDRLRGYGAAVTTYGDGLVERVSTLAPDGIDRAYDMSPPSSLADLIELVGGDPGRVLTISDHDNADSHGVPATGRAGTVFRWDTLPVGIRLAAEGKLDLPVQVTFALEEFAEAQRLSEDGHVTGKLVFRVGTGS